MSRSTERKNQVNGYSATPFTAPAINLSDPEITKEPLSHHLFKIIELHHLAEHLVGRTATGRELLDYETYKTLREWEISLSALGNLLYSVRRDAYLHEELAVATEFLSDLKARLNFARKWRQPKSLLDEFNPIVRSI